MSFLTSSLESFRETLVDISRWADYLGTFAFAISGIRLAAAHRFDWFGALVVGLVTAVGGGTIRDLLLHEPVFWLIDPSYLIITALALLVTVLFKQKLVHFNSPVFIFDAIGLGLFTAVGVSRSIAAEFPWWVAPIMGTVTGSFGGMLRDILINEVPLIFRSDFYAMACLIGSFAYFATVALGGTVDIAQAVTAITVIVIRFLATRYGWNMPSLKLHHNEEEREE